LPVYSHIYSRGARLTFDLTATMTVRNTDRQAEIILTRVSYYDMNGSLATTDFVIEESDRTGGTAPSFIVEWIADSRVSDPIIQSVMIGTISQQGISFLGNGKVLESR